MSLNGLDDAKVKEAHDATIAELGGWFLLKYISRDEVTVLGKGNGGIVEIRNAIAQYDESSPLFGFLRYRRRSVLINYVPEDCSRLVQARASVHFSAFTERFTPHDTVFSIASPKELRDTSLSAACSLHTASGSTSSSTSSLRRRRLMEIAEEAEEDQRVKRQSTVHEERPATGKESGKQAQPVPDSNTVAPATNLRSTNTDAHAAPKLSTLPTSDHTPSSPTRRLSSQSVRPDMYTLSSYGTSNKPKIKLGPRPSLDHKLTSNSAYRPVSSLPAGLRLFRRGSKKKSRPQSTYQSAGISLPITDETPGQPEMREPIRPHTSSGHPTTSSGPSLRNVQLGSSPPGGLPPASRGTAGMTPEKVRLMKALQMRKKQMSSTKPESLSQTSEAVKESQAEEAFVGNHPEIKRGEAENEISRMGNTVENDSGVGTAMVYATNDLCSEITKTDSSPTSPIGTEHAASTKASSLSESTEETIKEDSTYPQERPSLEEVTEARAEIDSVDVDAHSLSNIDEAQEDEAQEGESRQEEVQEDEAQESESHQDEALEDETLEGETLEDETLEDEALQEEDLPDGGKIAPPTTPAIIPTAPSTSLDEEPHTPTTKGDEIIIDHRARSDVDIVDIEGQPEITPPHDKQPITEDSEISGAEDASLVFTTRNKNLPQEEPASSVMPTVSLEVETTSTAPVPEHFCQSEAGAKENPSTAATETTKRDLTIPRSKFSMSNLRMSKGVVTEEQDPSSADGPPPIPNSLGLLEDKDMPHKHQRKTSQIDRIRTDFVATDSDNEFLEDDDLMDELQSATVQEAKPISVAKSPISHVFPVSPKRRPNEANRVSRIFSNPLMKDDVRNKGLAVPEKIQIGRSVSAGDAFLNRISQQQSAPVAKKVNVGSGISQRIKALEKFSSLPPTTGTLPTSGPTSPTFFSVRQSSVRSAKSPSIADRANSLTKSSPSLTPSPSYSTDTSPEIGWIRDRSGSTRSRNGTLNNTPSSRTPTPSSSRPESVSVTARIVRDPSQPFPQYSEAGKTPSEYGPLDLKSSPLTIDHQTAGSTSNQPTIQERRSSKEIKNERRSSITIVKDLLTSPRRASFSSIGKQSITIESLEPLSQPDTSTPSSSRPASVSSRRSNGLSPSPSATLSPISPRESGSKPPLSGGNPKSGGRGMKILRRMSSGFSNGRKNFANAISPTVREEAEPASSSLHTTPQSSQVSIGSNDVGDVNVQFPDTLLWKRRHLLLDSQGYLVLSASQAHGASNAIAATKRYHMNDFKPPFVPDIESQELPNSVSLEFIQGGGLQFACEDRAAQSHVLHLLEDAHRAWVNDQQ